MDAGEGANRREGGPDRARNRGLVDRLRRPLTRTTPRRPGTRSRRRAHLGATWRDVESHQVDQKRAPQRAVLYERGTVLSARPGQYLPSPTDGFCARQLRAKCLSLALGRNRCAGPRSPFTAAHTHRAPKPPRSSHPPKSVLVVRCSPSHSFLLCCLSIDAAFY